MYLLVSYRQLFLVHLHYNLSTFVFIITLDRFQIHLDHHTVANEIMSLKFLFLLLPIRECQNRLPCGIISVIANRVLNRSSFRLGSLDSLNLTHLTP